MHDILYICMFKSNKSDLTVTIIAICTLEALQERFQLEERFPTRGEGSNEMKGSN